MPKLATKYSYKNNRNNSNNKFDVFLTVHHSRDLCQVTNLMHNSFIL